MRISIKNLGKRRREKKSHFLIFGATGFLGSHLFIALCEKGYPITLICRPTNTLSVHERVNEILAWFGKSQESCPIRIIEGHIDRPKLGMTETDYQKLALDIDEIIHCASNTDFAERRRKEIEAVNVDAFRAILDFAAASHCDFFHYISTVYSAGKTKEICHEELSENNLFYNVYEETKNLSEHIAVQICKSNGIRLSIYRPSIVYGDSESGRSRKFNALYFPVKTILFLRDIMLRDIKKEGGKRAKTMGIAVLDDGRIHMPIRMKTRIGGKINLIPVNYFTAAMMAIIEEDLQGSIHQIANDAPNNLENLIGYINRFAGIAGLQAVDEQAFEVSQKNALEELFESYISMYLPYIADLRRFSMKNTKGILDKQNIECPRFTYDVFDRCMSYAVAMRWGKNLEANK